MKSMIKIAKSILPLLGLLLSLSLSAQDIAVKGHVKDHTGEPLIGANILIKGTSVGTISDSSLSLRRKETPTVFHVPLSATVPT